VTVPCYFLSNCVRKPADSRLSEHYTESYDITSQGEISVGL